MRNLSKKSKTIIAGAAIAGFASAGGAYAYWTNSGTGTGTAATGTNVGITVYQTSTVAGLYPGGPALDLVGDFKNTNAGNTYVTAVTATLGTLPSGCVAADFTIGGTAPVNADVIPGNHVGAWSGLTIKMNNTAVSQDGCKISTIPLVLASS